jgi:glucose-6-phosphate 1-dehydrogenase
MEKDITNKGSNVEICEPPVHDLKTEPFTIVIFGGAGDYTRRMLIPSLYHLFHDEALSDDFSIIGFGLPEMSDEQYRSFVFESLEEFSNAPVIKDRWKNFARHVTYIPSAFEDETGFQKLYSHVNAVCNPNEKQKKEVIFYLAVPPPFYPLIIKNIEKYKLCEEGFDPKVVVEKPFGHDQTSAVALNNTILQAFREKQIYRIDHYLGKETVQNIIFFRFANSIFEPLWNRRYINHVEISVAEQIGIEHRGAFYESAGVVRDVIQNHMMQLIALVAMEPPVGLEADLIRDEKVKILKAIRPMNEEYIDTFMVRGQYGPGTIKGKDVNGYREEESVAVNSYTPTFFAGKFFIDNWRWSGIPFYLRTGKRLPRRTTEIIVHFTRPPLRLFGKDCDVMEPNFLTFQLQPQEKISLNLSVKYPGIGNQPFNVAMDFNYADTFKDERHSAHERLILDCLRGDLTLFARQDGIEAMWQVVDPIIKRWEERSVHHFPNYIAGSWGPEESDDLMTRDGLSWSNRSLFSATTLTED